jgi:putative glutamine amidotransferase
MKPLVGISCCMKAFGTYGMLNHAASDTYVRAVDQVVGGVAVLLPANGEAADVETLLDRLDGIILTGSRSNVAPSFYDGPAHAEGTPEDVARDKMTLPLIRGAVARGIPVLAICRGLQEMNVALGGSLHQRLQDLPGRMDHSTPINPDSRVRTGKAHSVRLTPGCWLHRLSNQAELAVNSLHNQGIDRLAPGLVVEAVAPDGTIEAVRHTQSAALAVGVQWHPEYDFPTDQVSRAIFAAFGDVMRDRGAKLAAD